ncbi:MAG: PIG-L family deacetylase [Acidimicrobiales bacterium]
MSTLVCFHAHPDDEVLSTGGLMAKAAAAGHRVFVVTATRGERGEIVPGVLADGEPLAERRVAELTAAAQILGAEPPRFLGYEDSGMMGEPSNDDPQCFWQADVDEAADRLGSVLSEVGADVLTVYDDHGLYGHPDHIQVHRVGLAAARRVGLEAVYESTVNRDRVLRSFADMEAGGVDGPSIDDAENFGVAEADLAFCVDVTAHLEAKRAAMVVHRSQIPDDSFFLQLPPDRFAAAFAVEWFAIPGRTGTGGPRPVELLPGL